MKTPREIAEYVLAEFNKAWPTALPSPDGQAAAELAVIVYYAVTDAMAEARKAALEEAAKVAEHRQASTHDPRLGQVAAHIADDIRALATKDAP